MEEREEREESQGAGPTHQLASFDEEMQATDGDDNPLEVVSA